MDEDHDELLVVGAGQMRTGTKSLKMALQILYGGKCYHMDQIVFYKKDHIDIWIKACDQGFLDKELSKKIFKGYVAAVDNPAAPFYNDLMRIYPNCKVILTVRDADDWVVSVRNTTVRTPTLLEDILTTFSFWSYGIPKFDEMCEKCLHKAFGKEYKILQHQDEVLKRCFELYNEEVRRTVPKERLLEFNSKDGWGPLCRFLDLPVPDEPFPHVNKTSEFINTFKTMLFRSVLKYGSIVAIALASGIFLYTKWH